VLRQTVRERTTFASHALKNERERSVARASDGWAATLRRFVVLPFAALTAALAGLLYVLLLPVCGIASVLEAIATTAWSLVRAGAQGHTAPRRPLG
jgi:hypothetical protein